MVSTFFIVDATGFEPATSASRTQRSTKLSHASLSETTINHNTIKEITCQSTETIFFIIFTKMTKKYCFKLGLTYYINKKRNTL